MGAFLREKPWGRGWVKTVSLYRFTRILQVQTSLPFLTHKVFLQGQNQSPFFDFQGFYRPKSVS